MRVCDGRSTVVPVACGPRPDTSLRRPRTPTARRPRPRAGSPSDDLARLHLNLNDDAKIPRCDRFSYAICHMAYGALNPDVVDLDLAVERGVVHSEQLSGAALVAAGDFERATYQLDLEARDLVIERDAAGDGE